MGGPDDRRDGLGRFGLPMVATHQAQQIATLLEAVDGDLQEPVCMVIIGGGAALLQHGATSPAREIDAWSAALSSLHRWLGAIALRVLLRPGLRDGPLLVGGLLLLLTLLGFRGLVAHVRSRGGVG